jgi:hypothetical protein
VIVLFALYALGRLMRSKKPQLTVRLPRGRAEGRADLSTDDQTLERPSPQEVAGA